MFISFYLFCMLFVNIYDNMNSFAEEAKTKILATQWMCGQPETLVIIKVDGSYVITAYGAAETIETFKNNALSTLEGSEVIIETPIA